MGNTNQQIYGLSVGGQRVKGDGLVLPLDQIQRYRAKPLVIDPASRFNGVLISTMVHLNGPGGGEDKLTTLTVDQTKSSGVLVQQGEVSQVSGALQLHGFSLQAGCRYSSAPTFETPAGGPIPAPAESAKGAGVTPTLEVVVGNGTSTERWTIVPGARASGRWMVLQLLMLNSLTQGFPNIFAYVNGVRVAQKGLERLDVFSLPGGEMRFVNGYDLATIGPIDNPVNTDLKTGPSSPNLCSLASASVQPVNVSLIDEGGPYDMAEIEWSILNAGSVSVSARKLLLTTPLALSGPSDGSNFFSRQAADQWYFRSTDPVALTSYSNEGTTGSQGPAEQILGVDDDEGNPLPDQFSRTVFDNSFGGQESLLANYSTSSAVNRISATTEFNGPITDT